MQSHNFIIKHPCSSWCGNIVYRYNRCSTTVVFLQIFLYGIIILVVFNTMNFGIKLDLQKVKAYLKKPFSPSIGVVCQFIVMPLVS